MYKSPFPISPTESNENLLHYYKIAVENRKENDQARLTEEILKRMNSENAFSLGFFPPGVGGEIITVG